MCGIWKPFRWYKIKKAVHRTVNQVEWCVHEIVWTPKVLPNAPSFCCYHGNFQKSIKNSKNWYYDGQRNEEKETKQSDKTIFIFCARQNIAFRGHRDDNKYFDNLSNNSGNFQALLEFRVESGDKVLGDHFATAPRNATNRSKTIHNELIDSCKKYIRQNLSKEILASRFFLLSLMKQVIVAKLSSFR